MVLSFFRDGETGLEKIEQEIISMLGQARHSFDVAMSTLVSGADADTVGEDVRTTDQSINESEQRIRRELLVHSAVQGTGDLAQVMGYLLIIKKIERIGDQAKNILNLAEEGVRFTDSPDLPELVEARDKVSAAFAETAELLLDPQEERITSFREEATELTHEYENRLRALMHSERPGRESVPLAMLYRYLKRIIANLAGVAATVAEPLDREPPAEDLDE